MQANHTINAGVATLKLSGRFDFSDHRLFRDSYGSLLNTPGVKSLDIDFGAVDYLDSSALGMLLLVNEQARANNIKLRLVECRGAVKQILDIANFSKVFSIS